MTEKRPSTEIGLVETAAEVKNLQQSNKNKIQIIIQLLKERKDHEDK